MSETNPQSRTFYSFYIFYSLPTDLKYSGSGLVEEPAEDDDGNFYNISSGQWSSLAEAITGFKLEVLNRFSVPVSRGTQPEQVLGAGLFPLTGSPCLKSFVFIDPEYFIPLTKKEFDAFSARAPEPSER